MICRVYKSYFFRDVTELLLQAGADVHKARSDGYNHLFHAVRSDKRDSVEILLAGRANPNGALRGGISCLQVAAAQGNEEITRFVLVCSET